MATALQTAATVIEKLGSSLDKRAELITAAKQFFLLLLDKQPPSRAAMLVAGLGIEVPDPDVAQKTSDLLPTLTVLHSLLASAASAKVLAEQDVAACKSLVADSCRRWAVRIPRFQAAAPVHDAAMTEVLAQVGRFQRLCYGAVWAAAERAGSPVHALQLRCAALGWCCDTAACTAATAAFPAAPPVRPKGATTAPPQTPASAARGSASGGVAEAFARPAGLVALVLSASQFAVKQFVVASGGGGGGASTSSAPAPAAAATAAKASRGGSSRGGAVDGEAVAGAALDCVLPVFERLLQGFCFPLEAVATPAAAGDAPGAPAAATAPLPPPPFFAELVAVWKDPAVGGLLGDWLRWLASLAVSAGRHDAAGDVHGIAARFIELQLVAELEGPVDGAQRGARLQQIRLQLAEARLAASFSLLRYRRSALRTLDAAVDGTWQRGLLQSVAAIGAAANEVGDGNGNVRGVPASQAPLFPMSAGCSRHMAQAWQHVLAGSEALFASLAGFDALGSTIPADFLPFIAAGAAACARASERLADLAHLLTDHCPLVALSPLHVPQSCESTLSVLQPGSTASAPRLPPGSAAALLTSRKGAMGFVPGSVAVVRHSQQSLLELPPPSTQPRRAHTVDASSSVALLTAELPQRRKLRWAADDEPAGTSESYAFEASESPGADKSAAAPFRRPPTAPSRGLAGGSATGEAPPRRAGRPAGAVSFAAQVPMHSAATPAPTAAAVPLTAVRPRFGSAQTPGLTTSRRPLRMAALGEADVGSDDEGVGESGGASETTDVPAATGSLLARFADLSVSADSPTPARSDHRAYYNDGSQSPRRADDALPASPGALRNLADHSADPSAELSELLTSWPPKTWWEALEGAAAACAQTASFLLEILPRMSSTVLGAAPLVSRDALASAAIAAWATAARARIVRVHLQPILDLAADSDSTPAATVLLRMTAAAATGLARLRRAAVMTPAAHGAGGTKTIHAAATASSSGESTPLWGDAALEGMQIAGSYVQHAVSVAIAGSSMSTEGDTAATRLAADVASTLGLVYNCAVVHVNAIASHVAAAAAAPSTAQPAGRMPHQAQAAHAAPHHPTKPLGGHAPRSDEDAIAADVVASAGDGNVLSSSAQLGSCDIASALLTRVIAAWERWVAHTQEKTESHDGFEASVAAAIAAAKLPVRCVHLCAILRHRVDELTRQMADPDIAGPILGAELTVAKQALSSGIARLVRWHLVEAVTPLCAALSSASDEVASACAGDLDVGSATRAAVAILVTGLSHAGTGSPLSSLSSDLSAAAATLATTLRRAGLAEVALARYVSGPGAPAHSNSDAIIAGCADNLTSPDATAARSRRVALSALFAAACSDALHTLGAAASDGANTATAVCARAVFTSCLLQNAVAATGIRFIRDAVESGSSADACCSQVCHFVDELRTALLKQIDNSSLNSPNVGHVSAVPYSCGRDALLSVAKALQDDVTLPTAQAESNIESGYNDSDDAGNDEDSGSGDGTDSLEGGGAAESGAASPSVASFAPSRTVSSPVKQEVDKHLLISGVHAGEEEVLEYPVVAATGDQQSKNTAATSVATSSACVHCSHIACLYDVAAQPRGEITWFVGVVCALTAADHAIAAIARGCRCTNRVSAIAALKLAVESVDSCLPLPIATRLAAHLLSGASLALSLGSPTLRSQLAAVASGVLQASLDSASLSDRYVPAQFAAASALLSVAGPLAVSSAPPTQASMWVRVAVSAAAGGARLSSGSCRAAVRDLAEGLAGALSSSVDDSAVVSVSDVRPKRTVAEAASQYAIAGTALGAVATAAARSYGCFPCQCGTQSGSCKSVIVGNAKSSGVHGTSLGTATPLVEAAHTLAASASRAWARALVHMGGGSSARARRRTAFVLGHARRGGGRRAAVGADLAPALAGAASVLGWDGLAAGGYEDLRGAARPAEEANTAGVLQSGRVNVNAQTAAQSSRAQRAAESRVIAAAGAAAARAAAGDDVAALAVASAPSVPLACCVVPGGAWGAVAGTAMSLRATGDAWAARGDPTRAIYCYSKALRCCEEAGLCLFSHSSTGDAVPVHFELLVLRALQYVCRGRPELAALDARRLLVEAGLYLHLLDSRHLPSGASALLNADMPPATAALPEVPLPPHATSRPPTLKASSKGTASASVRPGGKRKATLAPAPPPQVPANFASGKSAAAATVPAVTASAAAFAVAGAALLAADLLQSNLAYAAHAPPPPSPPPASFAPSGEAEVDRAALDTLQSPAVVSALCVMLQAVVIASTAWSPFVRAGCSFALARLLTARGLARDALAVAERGLSDAPGDVALAGEHGWPWHRLAPPGALHFAAACACAASLSTVTPSAGTEHRASSTRRLLAFANGAVEGMARYPLLWGSSHPLRCALRLSAVAILSEAPQSSGAAELAAQCILQSVGWTTRLATLFVSRKRRTGHADEDSPTTSSSTLFAASSELVRVAAELSVAPDSSINPLTARQALWECAMDPMSSLQGVLCGLSAASAARTKAPCSETGVGVRTSRWPVVCLAAEPLTRTLLIARVSSSISTGQVGEIPPAFAAASVSMSGTSAGAGAAGPDNLTLALAELDAILADSASTLSYAAAVTAPTAPLTAMPGAVGPVSAPPAAGPAPLSRADKQQWWASRFALDARMAALCEFLQSVVLGPAAVLLAPEVGDEVPALPPPLSQRLASSAAVRPGGAAAVRAFLPHCPQAEAALAAPPPGPTPLQQRHSAALQSIAAAAQADAAASTRRGQGRSVLAAVAAAATSSSARSSLDPASVRLPLGPTSETTSAAGAKMPAKRAGATSSARGSGGKGPLEPLALPGPLEDTGDCEEDDDVCELARGAGGGTGPEQGDYSRLRVTELRAALVARGLPDGGLKADLIARLAQHDITRATSASNGSAPMPTSSAPCAPVDGAAAAPAAAPPGPAAAAAGAGASSILSVSSTLPALCSASTAIRAALDAARPPPDSAAVVSPAFRVLVSPQVQARCSGAASSGQSRQEGVVRPLLLVLCEALGTGLPWERMPLLQGSAADTAKQLPADSQVILNHSDSASSADSLLHPSFPVPVSRIPAWSWAYASAAAGAGSALSEDVAEEERSKSLAAVATPVPSPGQSVPLLDAGLAALSLYAGRGVPSCRLLPAAASAAALPLAAFKQLYTYIINPAGDLSRTQRVLAPLIDSLAAAAAAAWGKGTGGKGGTPVVGWAGRSAATANSSPAAAAALIASGDMFLYCGHGGGEALCPRDVLAHSALRLPPALLMGCSSGRLTVRGHGEPEGLAVAYLQAGCAGLAGCLWDVTDRDLDRYTRALVTAWLLPDFQQHPGQRQQLEVQAAPLAALATESRSRVTVGAGATASGGGAGLAASGSGLGPSSLRLGVTGSGTGTGSGTSSLSDPLQLDLPLPLCAALVRGVCKLPFLVGAAPVCYGLPVSAVP